MAQLLDTRPKIADIAHYAGDTLSIKVIAPYELVNGRDWSAQIRATRESEVIDAVFNITIPVSAGGPAYLVLPAAECRRLASSGGSPVGALNSVTRSTGNRASIGVMRYSGVWDCQVSSPAGDPVNTLVQGSLTLDLDVTRD